MAVTIAPWLKGTDALAAITAGADTGLKRAQLQQQAQESAARIALARAQMMQRAATIGTGSEERNALYAERLRQEAERARRLQEFREAQLGLREQGLTQQGQASDAANALRSAELGLREKHLGFVDELAKRDLDRKVASMNMPDIDRQRFRLATAVIGKLTSSPEEIKKAQDSIDEMTRKYSAGTAAPAAPAAATGLVEGQKVRNKVTGQMGTVINGQIVPDEVPQATPVAEENPYPFTGLPGTTGFYYLGDNYDIPAQ